MEMRCWVFIFSFSSLNWFRTPHRDPRRSSFAAVQTSATAAAAPFRDPWFLLLFWYGCICGFWLFFPLFFFREPLSRCHRDHRHRPLPFRPPLTAVTSSLTPVFGLYFGMDCWFFFFFLPFLFWFFCSVLVFFPLFCYIYYVSNYMWICFYEWLISSIDKCIESESSEYHSFLLWYNLYILAIRI